MRQYDLSALAARFSITAETRAKLAKVSRSTVERTLRRERKRHKAGGKGSAKPRTLLKQRIPVRIFWQWEDKKPGFCETGFVSDEYAFTLSLADAAACRSGFHALKNNARKWTVRALQKKTPEVLLCRRQPGYRPCPVRIASGNVSNSGLYGARVKSKRPPI